LAGYVERKGEMGNADIILIAKPEGKRPLRGPRRRWEEHITMDLREKWWEAVDWVHLLQDRDQCWALLNIVIKLRVA